MNGRYEAVSAPMITNIHALFLSSSSLHLQFDNPNQRRFFVTRPSTIPAATSDKHFL
jgi:hypothetical protein